MEIEIQNIEQTSRHVSVLPAWLDLTSETRYWLSAYRACLLPSKNKQSSAS